MRTRDPAELRRAIDARGLTFAELGVLADVSAGFVSHLVPPAGDLTRRPRKPGCLPETARRLAGVLRRPVGELFVELARDETGPLPVVRP